ncbi:MAG TPA: ABC transporter ATP-binding protein [Hyphomicrobiaceae bacterium]|nr:ABC transporter ATP-binding protein [Hyphomicrobiaceae bacterium]
MNPVVIRLDRVSAQFKHRVKGAVAAVHDVSFEVRPGELLTLLGPSGCGKTTTLRMIAGFQVPAAGRIYIGDRDVTGSEANDRGIGFVFQNYALFPHLTVFENVAYGLRVQHRVTAEITRMVAEVLSLVGLAGYEPQMPHQLSGGEQQRVALARAIVIRPAVLLFDEPLSNLDAKLRLQMRGEIRSLQKKLGVTSVYVTHDQEEAMAISDRIAVMNKGEIAQIGDAEELYRRPASLFVARFIGQANLIKAQIARIADAGVELDIAGHRHNLVATEAVGLERGQAVTAVVRPEALMIVAPGKLAGGLAGVITSCTYLGDKCEYTVDFGGTPIHVTKPNPQPGDRLAPGMQVAVQLPPAGVQLLPEERK